MFDCWAPSTINYAVGLFVGWCIWGRRARDLSAAIERHVTESRAVLGVSRPRGRDDASTGS